VCFLIQQLVSQREFMKTEVYRRRSQRPLFVVANAAHSAGGKLRRSKDIRRASRAGGASV
jgi:hypothetical protein